jgi:hypothetical protein
MLVYMLLTESFEISDDTPRKQLCVPDPSEDSGGMSSLPLRRPKSLKTINEAGQSQSHSGNLAEVGIAHGADGSPQAPGDMVVQCFDGSLARWYASIRRSIYIALLLSREFAELCAALESRDPVVRLRRKLPSPHVPAPLAVLYRR